MNVKDEIEKYLSQKSNNGALLITGKWGCGKTYLFRNIMQDYNAKSEYLVILISLFGVDKIDNLHRIIKEAVAFSKGFKENPDNAIKCFKRIKEVVTPITSAFSNSSKFVKGINTALTINWSDFFTIEKKVDCFFNGKNIQKDLVIIFDDFERSEIKHIDLMGALNYYSETKDIKVIIVANEEEINKKKDGVYKDIKEKLISRTIHMKIDIDEIVNNIINSYNETVKDYKHFLKNNISIIKRAFYDSQSDNIRSLKSVLMDFERVYESWIKSDIPMEGNIDNVLYKFSAAEFEYKSGYYINAMISFIIHVEEETDEAKKKIEGKYLPDTFSGFFKSLSQWIVDGEWDEVYFIDEIKKRYIKEDLTCEQKFILYNFWDLQQKDIDSGMPAVIQKAYEGKASRDDLIALLQKIHSLKEYDIGLPCEVDYKRIESAFEERKIKIESGEVEEPIRRTFTQKSQIDSEAIGLYQNIEFMDNQIFAWKNRQLFVSYLNDEGEITKFDLKNKYLKSFDNDLLDLYIEKYKSAQNGDKRELCWVVVGFYFNDSNCSTRDDIELTILNFKLLLSKIETIISTDTDKISVAIAKSFVKLLNEKIENLSERNNVE